jgi:hypothetical protein
MTIAMATDVAVDVAARTRLTVTIVAIMEIGVWIALDLCSNAIDKVLLRLG